MKGLELSEKFYKEVGEPMLSSVFKDLMPYLAVGLVGSGSECLGYDDEVSRDHDFEPGFCIFIPNEDVVNSKAAFSLERAYAKLPKEFMGFKRLNYDAVGGARHGVIRISDFFLSKTGSPDGRLSVAEWFSVPEHSLLEAVGGKVFFDNLGEFSRIRERLSYYPRDIALKKLAGNLLLMGQAGLYNYPRVLSRGETGAAGLAAHQFTEASMNAVFILNGKYKPYYKWSFRALRELPLLNDLAEPLEFLISSGNDSATAEKKQELIKSICLSVAKEIKNAGLVSHLEPDTQTLAHLINNAISDNNIRNQHILSGV